ncbi:MAG: AarF/ABC1/UbiB kinase family protein [Cyanobacteria bacterium J06639_1]
MRRLISSGSTDEPELPPPEVLRNILVELGPVFVKLGQLLSTRPDLVPPSYIRALSDLQTNVPAVDWAEVEVLLRKQLDVPLEEAFQHVEHQAIAAGSIAQTHKAVLADGRQVALKVQRPGIQRVVDRDIGLLKAIAGLVASTEFGKYYDVESLAEEFSLALRAELDFTQEANYTERLQKNLSASQWFEATRVVVPQVMWEHTSERLLVLEWLEGVPLLKGLSERDSSPEAEAERKAITTLLFRAFFQQFLIDGFFHADPHPGNLFYLGEGRVAILDCGMMGSLDPRTRGIVTELVIAIAKSDAQRCTQLTMQIAEPIKPVNLMQLESEYERLLQRYYNLSLSQIDASEAFFEVLQAARRNNLRWPGNIGLFAKSLANLEGAGRQFNPTVNVLDEVRPLMTDLFQKQLVGDDPLQALLQTALEFKNLSLESPRQFSFLLNRLSFETLKFNMTLRDLDTLRRSLDDSANRLSYSIVVGSLVIGAAILSSGEQSFQVYWLSNVLFAAASLLGLWLVLSILRSGRLR